MKFVWDTDKADVNRRKHGVEFDDATTVFGDPLAGTFLDPDHSIGELRLITVGKSSYRATLGGVPHRELHRDSHHQCQTCYRA